MTTDKDCVLLIVNSNVSKMFAVCIICMMKTGDNLFQFQRRIILAVLKYLGHSVFIFAIK